MVKSFNKEQTKKSKKKKWHDELKDNQQTHQKNHFPERIWPSDSENSKHKGHKI